MLKTENRLRKDRDFRRVFKESRPLRSGSLVFRSVPSRSRFRQDVAAARFGLVISNKIEKSAVRRNKIKRLIRQAIQELLPEIKPGFDVVVLVKDRYNYPFDGEIIRRDVAEGLKREGIFKAVER